MLNIFGMIRFDDARQLTSIVRIHFSREWQTRTFFLYVYFIIKTAQTLTMG